MWFSFQILVLLFCIFHDFYNSADCPQILLLVFLIVHLFVEQSLIRTLECRF